MTRSVELNDLPVYSVVGDCYAYRLVSGGKFRACSIFEAFVPAGNGPPPPVHSRDDAPVHPPAESIAKLIQAASKYGLKIVNGH
jgi:hypothetical protein